MLLSYYTIGYTIILKNNVILHFVLTHRIVCQYADYLSPSCVDSRTKFDAHIVYDQIAQDKLSVYPIDFVSAAIAMRLKFFPLKITIHKFNLLQSYVNIFTPRIVYEYNCFGGCIERGGRNIFFVPHQ
jgi:hypothetical protein